MNNATAIVPANSTSLARISSPANNSSPPAPRLKGHSFSHVYEAVMARADRQLPDQIVHFADLAMTPAGLLVAPGLPSYRLNDWSRKQAASLLGIRWSKWFSTATPQERGEEVTRRLQRTPGEIKIRGWKDDTGAADGIARALLSPGFSPISDARVFDKLHVNLGSALDTYRFTSVDLTDSTTQYAAVRVEALDLGGGDLVRPGWRLRNSEVGGAALSLDDYFLRQICENGLMIQVGGKRALYRTHRAISDDMLAAGLLIALGKLPSRWATAVTLLKAAKTIEVAHPDDAVAAVLDGPEVPVALVAKAQEVVLRDGDRSRFGVISAITFVAHAHNDDAEIRFSMEKLAGDYLNAQVLAAA